MTRDQGAMDPDDLDFTDDERVLQIDEDRYVVSGDGPPQPRGLDVGDGSNDGSPPRSTDSPPDAVTQADVSRWLAASFEATGFTYGFDATLAVENEVVRHRLVSNDLPTTFETLVSWFVRNSTTNATPEEALGILLSASELPVRYPPGTLARVVESADLGPEDTIRELLEALDGTDAGVRIPPRPD